MVVNTAETAIIRHGYSMADIDRMARRSAATLSGKWSTSNDYAERYEDAWCGIAECLYARDDRPSEQECLDAGDKAILYQAQAAKRHHGWERDTWKPAFVKFWDTVSGSHDDFTEGLAERLALPQVLALLTGLEYEALVAVATHGSQRKAADSLGVPARVVQKRIGRARARIAAEWFGGETPPRSTPRIQQDEMCRNGHSRAEHGYKGTQGIWVCRRCGRNAMRRLNARRGSRAVLDLTPTG